MENNEDIREPKPSFFDKIIDDEEDYYEFKKKIMSDNSIDINFKKVILESRKEYIMRSQNQQKYNLEVSIKNSYFVEFISDLELKSIDSNIFFNYKLFILVEIKKWIDGKIILIELEFEMCYDIYNIIKNLNINYEKKKIII